MQFVDTAPVSGTRMTKDGYLVADVRVARTGIQQYLAREIGLNRDGIVNVYRPEETVFSKDSMATFSGKPVTMLHPPEAVTADNWRNMPSVISERISLEMENLSACRLSLWTRLPLMLYIPASAN